MSAVVQLPDLPARAAMVRAAAEAALAVAAARVSADRFAAGTLWRDRRHGGVVEVRGRTIGAGGRTLWLAVATPGTPPGVAAALRTPAELAPITGGAR